MDGGVSIESKESAVDCAPPPVRANAHAINTFVPTLRAASPIGALRKPGAPGI